MVWLKELAMSEQLRSVENRNQYHQSEPLVSEMGQQEVQSSETKQEEDLEVIQKMQPSDTDITDSVSIGKQAQVMEAANGFLVFGTQDVALQDVVLQYEPSTVTCTPAVGISVIPYDGISPQMNVASESMEMRNEHEGSSDKRRRGRSIQTGPVLSSWSLRSKSQEKPMSPEPGESAKEWDVNREEKRGRKRKLSTKNNLNEFSRTKTHLRYLLHRIKYEQSLIDAYSAEGWKGQSLEKLKPEKELQRAKLHILRYKLKIRALFEHLDHSLANGRLPESLFDSKGEIDSEDIFCAKCGSKDLTLDNDIILCDGACVRGFHQYCLEPPLLKEHIPPGDEGWICPGCNCKQDCIDMLKDFHSTKVSLTDSWENIFPEAARAASGDNLDTVSATFDDSEDDDYDPDKPESSQKDGDNQSSSKESGYFSAPDDLGPCKNETYQLEGLPSDDSEDGDFDPSGVHQEEPAILESSDFTSDSEDLGALLEDEMDHQNLPPNIDQPSVDSKENDYAVNGKKIQSLEPELPCLNEIAVEPVSGKRHVERLDYKKLHDEAYGNYSSDSSDEDFEEAIEEKKKRSYREKRGVKSSNQTSSANDSPGSADENRARSRNLPKRARRRAVNIDTAEDLGHSVSEYKGSRRSSTYKRLGDAVTQKLYSSFLENKYPDKSFKEKLANELGISLRQVSKWFENARWSYNHKPKPEPSSVTHHSNQITGLQESGGAVAPEGGSESLPPPVFPPNGFL